MKENEIVLSKEVLDDDGLDLMLLMLQYDPEKRISAEDALQHVYFRNSE